MRGGSPPPLHVFHSGEDEVRLVQIGNLGIAQDQLVRRAERDDHIRAMLAFDSGKGCKICCIADAYQVDVIEIAGEIRDGRHAVARLQNEGIGPQIPVERISTTLPIDGVVTAGPVEFILGTIPGQQVGPAGADEILDRDQMVGTRMRDACGHPPHPPARWSDWH